MYIYNVYILKRNKEGFMATTITKKYQAKVANANSRGIPISLTLEEFRRLLELSDVCDYTGIKFDNAKHRKSIERVNDSEGYHSYNCCVVSQRVNQLKDTFFDKNTKNSISPEELELINRIDTTLKSKTREELVSKYLIKDFTNREQSSGIKTKTRGIGDIMELHNKTEIEYVTFYQCMYEKDNTFIVDFSKFKSLCKRKTCSITRRPFIGEGSSRPVLIKINNEQPWSNDNIQIVCSIVKGVLESGITDKELTRIANHLGE